MAEVSLIEQLKREVQNYETFKTEFLQKLSSLEFNELDAYEQQELEEELEETAELTLSSFQPKLSPQGYSLAQFTMDWNQISRAINNIVKSAEKVTSASSSASSSEVQSAIAPAQEKSASASNKAEVEKILPQEIKDFIVYRRLFDDFNMKEAQIEESFTSFEETKLSDEEKEALKQSLDELRPFLKTSFLKLPNFMRYLEIKLYKLQPWAEPVTLADVKKNPEAKSSDGDAPLPGPSTTPATPGIGVSVGVAPAPSTSSSLSGPTPSLTGQELSKMLHKKELFKTCPPVKRNPLMEGDACNEKTDWAIRGKYLKTHEYDCKISDVTFVNDEDNFASYATVDVMCEKAGSPTYVVRFKKLFQMKLQTVEKDTEMQKLLDLMNSLEDIGTFVKFAEKKATSPDKVKWCAVNAGAPAIPVISSVQAAGKNLTFVVTRSRDLASNETKRIVVESNKVRVSPNSQHVVIQTGPQAYSVFEMQPDISKFRLSPVDLEQLQSIIKQNA